MKSKSEFVFSRRKPEWSEHATNCIAFTYGGTKCDCGIMQQQPIVRRRIICRDPSDARFVFVQNDDARRSMPRIKFP